MIHAQSFDFRLAICLLSLVQLVTGYSSGSSQEADAGEARHSGETGDSAVATKPTAVIETTSGKLTCTLFPDKAPIGVANFVGLSRGTKDWMNPVNGKKMHGVPLYDGTIFHRVIPGS